MDKQNEDNFKDGILEMAKALADIQDRAVVTYTPLVDEICSRIATEKEVDHLLTWMFDFVENECMLLLFKKVCRTYFYTYPETVGFYILDAGGNLAASNIRNLECPSYEVYLIDYGCGKFNKKVHIME